MEKYKFDFPARFEDINSCNDVTTLKEWQNKFNELLTLAESRYGQDFVEAPSGLRKVLQINEKNENNIAKKIHWLTRPISQTLALKTFHDVVRQILKNKGCEDLYKSLVFETKQRLGRPDDDFSKMIEDKPKQKFNKR